MSIATKRGELERLGKYITSHPDDQARIERYSQLRAELDHFNSQVKGFLEAHFEPARYRSLSAILTAIPTGSLKHIYTTWLDELAGLNLITQEQAQQAGAGFNE